MIIEYVNGLMHYDWYIQLIFVYVIVYGLSSGVWNFCVKVGSLLTQTPIGQNKMGRFLDFIWGMSILYTAYLLV